MAEVCKLIDPVAWTLIKDNWDHLKDLPLQQTTSKIDILLGLDNADVMVPMETRRGSAEEPFAVRTALGWIARGCIGQQNNNKRIYSCIAEQSSLDRAFKQFWEDESFATQHRQEVVYSKEDRRALDAINAGLRLLDGGGYEAKLPWKEGEPTFENNFEMAKSRMRSLTSRFNREPQYEKEYRAAIQKYLDEGYAHKVEGEEPSQKEVWYLPHHGVYKKSSAAKKLRVVFDSAAKFKGKCLNDALLTGPPLQNELARVLLRFREFPVGFGADIEAMFSRIRLKPDDARYHRFLWQEKEGGTLDVYQMDRLAFGDTSSPCVAISTVLRTAEEFGEDDTEVKETVRKKMYIDDYCDSAKTTKDAISRAERVAAVLKNGDFNLRKWVSSSAEFNARLAGKDNEEVKLNNATGLETKVLGLVWKPNTDCLQFKGDIEDISEVTRRNLLSQLAGLFDPLGFLSPVTIKAKLIMKNTCLLGYDGDEELPLEIKNAWATWQQKVRALDEFTLPRCLKPYENEAVELHTFCVASEEAFAAAVYVRCRRKEEVTCRLAMAKTKVAPRRTLSVAKLELKAALLGSRMANYVETSMQELPIRRQFWTDSSCVRN